MPNWCENYISIYHKDKAMIDRAEIAFNNNNLLTEFMPIPEDLNIEAGFFGNDTEKSKEMQAKYDANKQKYGVSHWYDWCIKNWGTKWDIDRSEDCNREDDNTIEGWLNTAWSPPVEFCRYMEEELGFEINLSYYEYGCGFVGEYYKGNDQCFDIPETAEQVREVIPDYLDDMFCISEGMIAHLESEDR